MDSDYWKATFFLCQFKTKPTNQPTPGTQGQILSAEISDTVTCLQTTWQVRDGRGKSRAYFSISLNWCVRSKMVQQLTICMTLSSILKLKVKAPLRKNRVNAVSAVTPFHPELLWFLPMGEQNNEFTVLHFLLLCKNRLKACFLK